MVVLMQRHSTTIPNANTDDNSCIAIALGCMNPQAFNYDPSANTDNASCIAVVKGLKIRCNSIQLQS